MEKLIYLTLLSIGFLFFQQAAHAALTQEQEEAKSKGLHFYNLKRKAEAMPYLRVAAEAGDAESQFSLGVIYKDKKLFALFSERDYFNDSGEYWFKRAAEQKYMHAMVQLFDTDYVACRIDLDCSLETGHPQTWRELALMTAEQRAAEGDADAMYQLYAFTGREKWWIKAASAGSVSAQFALARAYYRGKGFFLTPALRRKEVDKWLSAAAEANYIPAISRIRWVAWKKNDSERELYWAKRGAMAGSLRAMGAHIAALDNTGSNARYPLDRVKAYGLSLLFIEAVQPSDVEYYLDELKVLMQQMTPEQLAAGKVYADEWKKTYPPLTSIEDSDYNSWGDK